MPTGQQLRGALDELLHAKPKPRKPLKIKTPALHQDEEILSWENMDIAKAKADAEAMPIADQIAALKESDEFASFVDSAQSTFKNAEQIYGGPKIPVSIINPAPLSEAVGPAFPMLAHYSDDALEKMATIAQNRGRGKQYLTSMTDETASFISRAFLKKSDINIGNPHSMRDDMFDYEYSRGFSNLPQIEAHVDGAGDVNITGIDRTKGDDGRGWNSAILLGGNTYRESVPKHIPVVINFDKPLFESNGKLTGRVFYTNEDGNRVQLVGMNVQSNKIVPKKVSIDDSSWAEAPVRDSKDAANRVGLMFSEKAGIKARLIKQEMGFVHSAQKLKNLVWPASQETADVKVGTVSRNELKESNGSYFPKDDSGESFFDKWVPLGSEARDEIVAYTKDSPYKARLVDPSAPKDAPLLIFRGAQGSQFLDADGKLHTLGVMDPRNAHEFGAHTGSLAQAEHFALRGMVRTDMNKPARYRQDFKRLQDAGNRILQKKIFTKPELTKLWHTFVDELFDKVGWGRIKQPMSFDESARMIQRPTHNTLVMTTYELLNEAPYKALKASLSGDATEEYVDTVNKATAALAKGNADIDAFVTNVKNPLILWDTGGFSVQSIANQLIDRAEFAPDIKELQNAISYADDMLSSDQGFSNIGNNIIRQVLEKKGYDHIAYINQGEFPGTPSFIFWKKDSLRPISDFGVPDDTLKLLSAAPIAVLAARAAMEEKPKDGNVAQP